MAVYIEKIFYICTRNRIPTSNQYDFLAQFFRQKFLGPDASIPRIHKRSKPKFEAICTSSMQSSNQPWPDFLQIFTQSTDSAFTIQIQCDRNSKEIKIHWVFRMFCPFHEVFAQSMHLMNKNRFCFCWWSFWSQYDVVCRNPYKSSLQRWWNIRINLNNCKMVDSLPSWSWH